MITKLRNSVIGLVLMAWLLVVFLPSRAHAQGTLMQLPPLTTSLGQPIAGATISVFTTTGNLPNLVCAAPVTVYKDVGLSIPFTTLTTDGNGNYPFFIQASANPYGFTVSGSGTTTSQCYGFTAPLPPSGGSPSFVNLTVTQSLFENGNIFATGTCAAPPYSFQTQSDAGLCLAGVGTPAISAGGVAILQATSTGVSVGGTLGVTGTTNLSGSLVQSTTNGAIDFEINHSIFSTTPNGSFPLGGDININCQGSCDLVLAHGAAKATASSTLNIGLNSNVALANISPLSSCPIVAAGLPGAGGPGTGLLCNFSNSGTAAWVVGRDTPNEEYCSPVTVVDATHVNITCAKSHTVNGADNNNQPLIDIEQGIGNTDNKVDGGGAVTFSNISPSQELGGVHPMVRIQGSDNVPYCLLPTNQSDAFPRNALNCHAAITGTGTIGAGGGQLPTPADLLLRNADSSHCVKLQNSTASLSTFQGCDTANTFGVALVDGTAGGIPAATGAIRLLNAHSISWRSSASTDLNLGVNAADGLSFDSSHVANATVPYVLAVANLTAQSAAVGPTTIRAVGAAQAGVFRVCWSAVVTQAATTSSTLGGANVGFQVTYTDNDTGAAVTTPLAAAPGAGTNTAYSQTNSQNVIGAQASGCLAVNAKASTNIQYNFGYTSVGVTAMQYALHVRVEPMN